MSHGFGIQFHHFWYLNGWVFDNRPPPDSITAGVKMVCKLYHVLCAFYMYMDEYVESFKMYCFWHRPRSFHYIGCKYLGGRGGMIGVKQHHLRKHELVEPEGGYSEAGRFCIFESPSVQFGEYFLIKFRQNLPISSEEHVLCSWCTLWMCVTGVYLILRVFCQTSPNKWWRNDIV